MVDSRQQLLLDVVHCHSFSKFKAFLENGDHLSADVLLNVAVANGWSEMLDPLLVKADGQVNKSFLLTKAVWNGHRETVELLIERGANVNSNEGSKIGQTALNLAAAKGNVLIAELLINQNAELHLQNQFGLNALMLAVWNSHSEVAKFLLDRGADPAALNCNGLTALHWAVASGGTETLELLAGLTEVNCPDCYGETPLGKAASLGLLESVCLLISRGAKIDFRDKEGWTPLMKACRNGHLKTAELLLEHGANVNDENNNGETALFWASGNNHVAIVKMLLERGANVTHKDKNGNSALHWASANRKPAFQTAQMLIDAGCSVQSGENGDGWTPLIVLAAHDGNVDTAQVLLRSGAQVNQRTTVSLFGVGAGWTPLMIAAQRRNKRLAKLLLENFAHAELVSNDGMEITALSLADNSMKTLILSNMKLYDY